MSRRRAVPIQLTEQERKDTNHAMAGVLFAILVLGTLLTLAIKFLPGEVFGAIGLVVILMVVVSAFGAGNRQGNGR